MDSLLSGFTPLVRVRLPGLTACLMCLTLLSSTSVQGSNGPLSAGYRRGFCLSNVCPGDGGPIVLLPFRLFAGPVLPRATMPPSLSADLERGTLASWPQPNLGASNVSPVADSFAGARPPLAQAPRPLNQGFAQPLANGGLTIEASNIAYTDNSVADDGSATPVGRSGLFYPSVPAGSFPDPSETPPDPQPREPWPYRRLEAPIAPLPLPVPSPLPVLGLLTALGYCRQFKRVFARGKRQPFRK